MLMLGKFHCKCAHLNKNRVKPTQLFLNFFPPHFERKCDSCGRNTCSQTADVKVLGFIYVNYIDTKEESAVK